MVGEWAERLHDDVFSQHVRRVGRHRVSAGIGRRSDQSDVWRGRSAGGLFRCRKVESDRREDPSGIYPEAVWAGCTPLLHLDHDDLSNGDHRRSALRTGAHPRCFDAAGRRQPFARSRHGQSVALLGHRRLQQHCHRVHHDWRLVGRADDRRPAVYCAESGGAAGDSARARQSGRGSVHSSAVRERPWWTRQDTPC